MEETKGELSYAPDSQVNIGFARSKSNVPSTFDFWQPASWNLGELLYLYYKLLFNPWKSWEKFGELPMQATRLNWNLLRASVVQHEK